MRKRELQWGRPWTSFIGLRLPVKAPTRETCPLGKNPAGYFCVNTLIELSSCRKDVFSSPLYNRSYCVVIFQSERSNILNIMFPCDYIMLENILWFDQNSEISLNIKNINYQVAGEQQRSMKTFRAFLPNCHRSLYWYWILNIEYWYQILLFL